MKRLSASGWEERKARSRTYKSTALSSTNVVLWLNPKSKRTCRVREGTGKGGNQRTGGADEEIGSRQIPVDDPVGVQGREGRTDFLAEFLPFCE